jgi:hypothetical protein
MTVRSLLNGQENYITFQMDLQYQAHGVGLIWNVLRRFVPETIVGQILGMRGLASMKGGVFDVPADKAQQFEDIFTHEKDNGRRLDFDLFRCESLPELFDRDGAGPSRGGQSGFGGG